MFTQKVAWPDLRIGDVFYLMGNPVDSSWRDWKKLKFTRWFKEVAQGEPSPIPQMLLSDRYREALRETGSEPDWFKNLPDTMKYNLRYLWLTSDAFEPLAILPYRQDLGFSFAVEADGLIHDVSAALNIFRLGSIRQLGFLHDPVINELAGDEGGMSMMFDHTRYMHSLTVMATASLCGKYAGLSEYDLKHLRVAAISHDTLTPAGGDSVKFIDYKALDEDAHYSEVFQNNPEWELVREKYGLSEKLLIKTVNGKGVLGRLLDFADKTSYVSHDLEMYLKCDDPRKYEAFIPPESIMQVWRQRERARGHVCKLWDKLRLVDGNVVVTNGRKLAQFLKLRALMFKHLYFNAKSRYREHILAVLVVEPLYRKGVLTRDMLLQMTDHNLEELIEKEIGTYRVPGVISNTDFAPVTESFVTREEAEEQARELSQTENPPIVMIEEFPQPNAKAMEYLVADYKGEVRTFGEAYPEEAAEILEIGADPKRFKLYILARENVAKIIPEAHLNTLLKFQEEKYRNVP